ncbi:hypothetical protein F-M6_0408 [Faustovirus]|nr:hypothetical protein F-M6_0408 [Faustovirus]QJX73163.1 hypothetical protein F-VV57_0402 [Faustovirus]QJX73670.1 hypothetical protein F-VV63_0404 [Faustovirus]
MLSELPIEIITLIVEALYDADDTVKHLARNVDAFAAVSRGCLRATQGAKWVITGPYKNKFVSAYGIDAKIEYRYLNRFSFNRLLEIDGAGVVCEYTAYSNAISRITSADINFVCYTPGHGIIWFDLLKAFIMLRAQCRWCYMDNESMYTDEILQRNPPLTDYGEESGMYIVDHMTNILREIRDQEHAINQRRQEVYASTLARLESGIDGGNGPNDDDDEQQEQEFNNMLDAMSEFFRTLIAQYTNHIHATTHDPAFIALMHDLYTSLTRPRVALNSVDSANEDQPFGRSLSVINAQICAFLNAIHLSFKFECKLYIKSQHNYSALPGVYFYQFEKLQDGHHLSRITKLQ